MRTDETEPSKFGDPAIPGAGPWDPPLDHLIVVVVDDEAEDRDRICAMLRSAGALVTPAGSAKDAFDILEAVLPDVLVSDMVMPGLTGCDLMEVVRTNPRTAALPAVALTPDDPAGDREQAFTAGFDFLLGKPLEPTALIETVATAAGRRPASPV
jgi:CheY-like chemotaxis protein